MKTFEMTGRHTMQRGRGPAIATLAALTATIALAQTSRAEPALTEGRLDPPKVVIDAEYVPSQPAGHVIYLPHGQEMLAVDSVSGAIRAVFPAPPRAASGSTHLAALTAGSVSVPAFGLVALAALFVAMVSIIFVRRTPAGA